VQQAQAIAVIANDGVGFRPHVVKSIESIGTGEVRAIAPEVTHTLNVKPEQLALIKAALAGVPKEGTSAQAFVGAKYTSGGKTGTAQLYSLKGEKYVAGHVDERLRDHAWYIAYAPAENPKIAVAVLVENGGFGAQAAAPIARAVFDYYLLGEQVPRPAAPGPGPRDADDESD
jgi:penicillin-binding protein 2